VVCCGRSNRHGLLTEEGARDLSLALGRCPHLEALSLRGHIICDEVRPG
jgi:hypothetical protein